MLITQKIRSTIIFLGFFALYIVAIIYLYYVQIKKHNFFVNKAHNQYLITHVIYPLRASIFDRNGKIFALNKDSFSAFITPNKLKDKNKLYMFLEKYYPSILDFVRSKENQKFVYIKRRLTEFDLQAIKASGLQDIHIITEPNRFYTNNAAASIIGITNIDGKGITGIELLYDKQLSGSPSKIFIERDARSGKFYFSKQIEQDEIKGSSVQLTLDSDLQFLVQEELESYAKKHNSSEGGVVIMDPEKGDILAMGSYPTYNPNDFQNITPELTKCNPLTQVYEFGSVMKIFCALAALEQGCVTEYEPIDCMNCKTVVLDGRRINTVAHTVLGVAPFKDVIKKSNNIGIAKVAKRVSKNLYDHYLRMGFASKTEIQLPGEQSGFIMPPDKWSQQSIISLSYGYEIAVSLLQLARAFSLFSNGGCLVKPRLLLNYPIDKSEPLYTHNSLNIMRNILLQTKGQYGYIEGYNCFGKTGTANLIENGVYNKNKNIFCFIGSIEKDSYKRVIACYLKESNIKNTYAANVVAPLFRSIGEKLVMHDHVW